jgi:voltage-gated potassium channel
MSTVEWIKNRTDTKIELAIIYALHILATSTLFSYIEDTNFGDSVWWAFGSGLGIGYGDIYPHTTAGRVLTVYLVLVTIILGIRLANITIVKRIRKEMEEIKSGKR